MTKLRKLRWAMVRAFFCTTGFGGTFMLLWMYWVWEILAIGYWLELGLGLFVVLCFLFYFDE